LLAGVLTFLISIALAYRIKLAFDAASAAAAAASAIPEHAEAAGVPGDSGPTVAVPAVSSER
jgi:hypothetical protein